MSSSIEPSSSETATPSNRYKTELCRSFEELGVCRYGDKCQYAHGSAELRSLDRHPRHKTELCRSFHTTGLCSYGYRCHFIHNEAQNLVTSLDEVQRGRKTLMTSLSEEERVRRTLMTSLDHAERGRRTLMTSLDDVERGRRKIKERILGLIARNVLHQQLLHAICSVAREVQNRVQSSPTDPDAYGRFVVSPTSLIKHQPEPITIPDVQRTHIGDRVCDGLRESSRRLDYSSSPDSPSFLGTSLSSISSGGTSQTWSSIDDSIPSPTWSSFEESCATTSFKYNSPPPSISTREVDSFATTDEFTTKYRFY